MAGRIVPLLTDRQINKLTKTTAVGGVPGLLVRVRSEGISCTKTFVLRQIVNKKESFYTIGPVTSMSLREARLIAADWKAKISKGINPVAELRAEKERIYKENTLTVEALLRDYIETETARGRWSSGGRQTHKDKAEGWIKNHIPQKILACPAKDLTHHMLAEAFSEKWETMRGTPDKILGEIKRAFDWGIALQKIQDRSNPAALSGPLRHLLPHESKRPDKTHYPHLPPERIPAFMSELVKSKSCAARALTFCILTASRVGNGLNVHWGQIDLEAKTFTIPREEMKIKGLTFDRVTPLSDYLVDLLRDMPRMPVTGDLPDYIFRDFTGYSGYPVSETSLRNHIRRLSAYETAANGLGWIDPNEFDNKGMNRVATPHGLARASFETWAYNPAQFNHPVYEEWLIEACLDHFSPKYGGAYMRGYPLEDMRKIFDDWARYCF